MKELCVKLVTYQKFLVNCSDSQCLVLCSFDVWNTAVQCLSVLDVLMSLAEYARSEGGEMCVPQFVLPSEEMKV